jgi:hypothetical protein
MFVYPRASSEMGSFVSKIDAYQLIVACKSVLENNRRYFPRSSACVKYWWRTSTIKE